MRYLSMSQHITVHPALILFENIPQYFLWGKSLFQKLLWIESETAQRATTKEPAWKQLNFYAENARIWISVWKLKVPICSYVP